MELVKRLLEVDQDQPDGQLPRGRLEIRLFKL